MYNILYRILSLDVGPRYILIDEKGAIKLIESDRELRSIANTIQNYHIREEFSKPLVLGYYNHGRLAFYQKYGQKKIEEITLEIMYGYWKRLKKDGMTGVGIVNAFIAQFFRDFKCMNIKDTEARVLVKKVVTPEIGPRYIVANNKGKMQLINSDRELMLISDSILNFRIAEAYQKDRLEGKDGSTVGGIFNQGRLLFAPIGMLEGIERSTTEINKEDWVKHRKAGMEPSDIVNKYVVNIIKKCEGENPNYNKNIGPTSNKTRRVSLVEVYT